MISSEVGIIGAGTSLQEVDTQGLWQGYSRSQTDAPAALPSARGTCRCGHGGTRAGGPLFRLLDHVAGGIEQVLGLSAKPCRDAARCDDGCDAVLLEELSGLDAEVVPMAVPGQPAGPRAAPPQAPQDQVAPPPPAELPQPEKQDEQVNPFEDEEAWVPGRNPAIRRSAYFE
jgi:hypothetical protein